MSQLICNVDIFAMGQNITFLDDNNVIHNLGNFELHDLEENLLDIASKEGCNKIRLFGMEDFLNDSIVPSLKEKAVTKYNINNIEIEVNN